MESWHGLSEAAILDMPATRRYRMILKKSDLERKREEARKAAETRVRSGRR